MTRNTPRGHSEEYLARDKFRREFEDRFFQECLGRARETYAAKGEQLEDYLVKLSDAYKGNLPNYRNIVQGKLEKLIIYLEGIDLLKSDRYSGHPIEEKSLLPFDYLRAREIRRKEGLTIRKLDEKLRGKGTAQYESGRRIPANPPKGEFAKKYLSWLKEQGYNPYHL